MPCDIVPHPTCETCGGAIPRRQIRPSHTPRWCSWECRQAGGHRGATRPLPPVEPHECRAGCGTILTTRRQYCSTTCRDSATGAPRTWADRHGVWPDQGHAPKTKRNRRYLDSHPGIEAAHRAVERALASGRLKRPEECEECGAEGADPVVGGLQAHHHLGYAPEHHLDVQWLCRHCHWIADRKQRRERLVRIPTDTSEGDGPVYHQ